MCPKNSSVNALSKNFLIIVFQNSPADSYWCRDIQGFLPEFFENLTSHPSRIPLMPNVHSAHRVSEYAGENRAGTGWDSMDSKFRARFA